MSQQMQPARLLSARSADKSTLGRSTPGNFEKGLSGTYDVPSGAAIAEKVHQLSLRRKKPAWATTRPSDEEEHTAAESHASQQADSASSSPQDAPASPDDHALATDASPASFMLQVFNAAPAAAPEAAEQLLHMTKQNQHAEDHTRTGDLDHSISSAEVAAADTVNEHNGHAGDRAAGGGPGVRAAAKAHEQQHSQDRIQIPHHLKTNRATLSRISEVAQEQVVTKMAKARQNSIEKHVMQHDMFQGDSQPVHTVHRPDAVSENFQEPTLAAILRENAVAGDAAKRQARKAARAMDDAQPLFLTTSCSLQSTSRQHSMVGNSHPSSRPASAGGTMTRHQFASELGVHAESMRSALHDSSSAHQRRHMSNLQSPRERGAGVRDAYSSSSTGRLGTMSSSLQGNRSRGESMDEQWRAAASGYAAQVLHPERSVGNSQQDNEDQSLETKGTNRQETNEEDDAAADFAEDLPAAMTEQSGVGPQSRLQRFDSLARGESADGVRHSRGISHQDETFSPQIDSHSSKLAEAVYEQTRVLGPTPLQGRLNYLHQLGKVTLRDRKASLMSLPQQREEVEFAMCTFEPKLNKRPLSEEWAGSVIERSQAWQERRDQKVRQAREQDADKDLQGCTFWPDISASSRSLLGTLEVAAMTRSLPEQEVLKYFAHGHPLPTAEGSSTTQNTFRSMHTGSMHELPADMATYISQMKYYERMHKVKEREQHIQEVLSKFDGSKWVYQVTKPCAPKLGQSTREAIPSLTPPVHLMPGMIAAQHALRSDA